MVDLVSLAAWLVGLPEPSPTVPLHRYLSAAIAFVFVVAVLAALLLGRGSGTDDGRRRSRDR
jgi:hypothetical protein